jgi:hypothetical protein
MKKIFFNLLIFSFLCFSFNACKEDPSPEKKIPSDSCGFVIKKIENQLANIGYYTESNPLPLEIIFVESNCNFNYLRLCPNYPDSLKRMSFTMVRVDGELCASQPNKTPSYFRLKKIRIDEEFHPKQAVPNLMGELPNSKLTKDIYLIKSDVEYQQFKAETGFFSQNPIDFDKFALVGYNICYDGCCEPIRQIIKESFSENKIDITLKITTTALCRVAKCEEWWFLIPKYNPNTNFNLKLEKNIIGQ